MLINKLGATEEPKRNHRKYTVTAEDGTFLASTSMSHGWMKKTGIGDPMVSTIARQLGVNSAQLVELVNCSITREQYVELALEEAP